MLAHIRPAITMVAFFTLLTGIIYPLAFTGIAQVAAPSQANGSLISHAGVNIGSSLIGQSFTNNRYFQGRPSAAGQNGYDASSSSGSNDGATSKKLLDRVASDVDKLKKEGVTAIPADAVTASGSGLDPEISPAFAEQQVNRIAASRHAPPARIREILTQNVQWPLFGVFGEPRVNVLNVNLALDAALGSGAG